MLFTKESIPWNKGTKGIMKAWNKGMKGIYSKKTLLKMKLAKLDTKRSPESIEKFRKTMSGRSTSFWTGKKLSIEHRLHISVGLKGKNTWSKGRKLTIDHIKNSLRRRSVSSLEDKVLKVINKYDLPYKFVGNGDFFIERKNPDFVNTNGKKIAVEVFARKQKDLFRGSTKSWKLKRNNIFRKYGWSIIYIEDWQTNKEKTILSLLKGGY